MGEKPLTWEYRVEYLDPHTGQATRELNRLGAEGWELVSVNAPVAYLKRPAGRQALDQNGGEHGG